MNTDLPLDKVPAVRAFTAVPVRRLRIRHLAQGSGCVQYDGPNQRIDHTGPAAGGVRFNFAQRLLYSINLKRAKLRFDPITALAQLGRATASASGGIAMRLPAVGDSIRLVPKLIAVAVVTLLSLAGVSRFVHIDIRTIAGSIHFGLPHFLTPWRPVDVAPEKDGATLPAALVPAMPANLFNPTGLPATYAPYVPTGSQQPSPEAPSPSQQTSPDGGTNNVPSYFRHGPGSYLPMPSGPLPAGMSTPTYVPSVPRGGSGAVSLDVHPAFTEPEEAPHDDVVLMTVKPEPPPAAAPAEHKDHATRKSEVHAAALGARVSEPAIQAPARRESAHETGDVVLFQRPGSRQAAAPSQMSPAADDTDETDNSPDPSAPVSLPVHPAKQQAAIPSAPTGPSRPPFSVVTHTDDSLVVQVDGKMRQISIGKQLPDGSKLLSVNPDGGGFTTTRGNFTAY